MIANSLQKLGDTVARLRIAKNLKQAELAYEAGISERTLQRMEAGDVVKTDGLLKVLAYLGRLDAMLEAIDTPSLSPYELVTRPGKGRTPGVTGRSVDEGAGSRPPRTRVRTSRAGNTKQDKVLKNPAAAADTPGDIVWPEDQA